MKRVACVGILVADVIVPLDGYPESGHLMPVDSITVHNGGNAMTAAINLTRLGVEATLVGKVGADAFGSFLLRRLEEERVNPRGVQIDKAVQTSASVVLLERSGERSFLHCKGANASFCLADIDFDVIAENDVVFVTGTYLMDTFDGEQTVAFLKRCREMGKTTVLDVCWDASGRWGELLCDAMPYIDYFLPSIDEAKRIAQCEDLDKMAEFFFQKGVGTVCIKCGSKGAYLRENARDAGEMLPCYPVRRVVDTTGAGDSFCSGFLSALARGLDTRSCVKVGNATGAHCVMAKGATAGIVSFDEILAFLASAGDPIN
ncbi:MAG: carbohydrate kinase family protein [Clostridia bacterium]|nr:carbohydrate kinase family protein [Clostridia bacterium]